MKRFISVCFLVLCCASWCLAQDNAEPSWKLLTSSLGLRAGDQIIIAIADDLADATTQRVMGNYKNSGKAKGYEALSSNRIVFHPSESTLSWTNVTPKVLTLVEDSIPGIYSLYDESGDVYLCAAHSQQTRLQPADETTIEEEGYNKLFDIWIDENGYAQITGYGMMSKNQIYYSNSDKKFICDAPGNSNNLNIRVFVYIDPNRVEAEGDKFISDTLALVKSIDDLNVGDNIIIADASEDFAVGAMHFSEDYDKYGRIRTGFTMEDETIYQYSPAMQLFTVAQGATSGTYAFVANEAYMSSSESLPLNGTLSANESWIVSVNANGVATLSCGGNYVRYNGTAQRFQSSTTNASVRIFKRVNKLVNVTYIGLDELMGLGNNIMLVAKGQPHQVPTFTSDPSGLGRTFIEWNTKRDGLGQSYQPGSTITTDRSLVLYPMWQLNVSASTILPAREDLVRTRASVQNGATLTIEEIVTLRALTLRGGRTSTGDYKMPSLYVDEEYDGALELINKTIYFDLSVDKAHYYPFAVPFPVAVNKVDYADETLANASVYGTHYVIKRYDGAKRAENGGNKDANWVKVEETETLQPGIGYIITAVPIGGEALIRFPMTPEQLWLSEDKTVDVEAHTGAAAVEEVRHAGWNFIANPYLCTFTGDSDYPDASGILANGALTYVDGEWVVTGEEVPYVTIPTPDFAMYEQKELTTAELLPEYPFFVQVAETGTLSFEVAGRQQNMPALRAASKGPLRMPLTISQSAQSDRTTLLVSDDYTTAYEIGKDLEKMFGSAEYLTLYSLMANQTPLAFCATPWSSAVQSIPLGYRTNKSGSVTIALDASADMSDAEMVLLYDAVTGMTTNLLLTDYVFETETGTFDARFTITITPKQGATTDCEEVMLPTEGTYKFIENGQLYINHKGVVYTVEGRENSRVRQ